MADTSKSWKSDVFIAHSFSETLLAREIKSKLETENQLKVFIFEDDIPNGYNILLAISNAIQESRRCVMILSTDFLKSDFFYSEYSWAMGKQNREGIIFCIPVLYKMSVDDLPKEFRHINCLQYDDVDFYQKLLNDILHDVKITTSIQVTQTGVGLAWSYYYGYLEIILPGLDKRVIECRKFDPLPVYPKMVIILPVSCRCPEVMPEEENFKHLGYIDHKVSRAANKERCYKSTVYDFTFNNKSQKKVHCCLLMEFATPLLSLRQMSDGKIAHLDKDQMTNERHTFKEVVGQILTNQLMKDCHGKYLLVDYRDEDEKTSSHMWTKETLSQVVARAVEDDMIEGKCTEQYLLPVTDG